MSQQNTLDFNRRNPLPRRLEAIIAAPLVPPKPVSVPRVEIAGAHPTIHERFRGSLRPLPVTRGRAPAANPKVPGFAGRRRHALMINQPRFVTTQQLSAAAIAHIVS